MARKTPPYLKDLLLVIFSGGLLVASFPSFDLGFFAWFALVPFLVVLVRSKTLVGFIFSFIFGALVIAGVFLWMFDLSKYTLLHHTLASLYLGLYSGVFGLVFSLILRRRGPIPAFVAAPFVWVSMEYLRGNLFFLALPWPVLAHSQYNYPLIIQFAAVTGTYGVSFLIVMVNCAITMLLLSFTGRFGQNGAPILNLRINRGVILTSLITAAFVVAAAIYGWLALSTPLNGNEIKVSVVQGNIGIAERWDRKYRQVIMQTYTELTRKASRDQPDLIIWPETATPRSVRKDPTLFARVKRTAMDTGNYLLVGSANPQKFQKNGKREVKQFNSALLITPLAEIKKNQRYDKIILLPFGEYLPHKDIINWSLLGIPQIGEDTAGKELTVFQLPNFKFAATICWENIFPDLVRQFVKRGAQFIVNMTNEAWFGKTAAPYQFVSMSVFRAVENRVFVVRCANTGVSCFIDPRGRIINRVSGPDGTDIFIRGVLTESITPLDSNTIYTRFGDWPVWLSLMLSMAFLLIVIFRKRAA